MKLFAADQRVDEFADGKVFLSRLLQHLVDERLVTKADAPTECKLDERGTETACEGIGLRGDDVGAAAATLVGDWCEAVATEASAVFIEGIKKDFELVSIFIE